MLRFILAGTPQVVIPWHVEAFMAARRVQLAGYGLLVHKRPTADSLTETIQHAAADCRMRTSLMALGARTTSMTTDSTVSRVVGAMGIGKDAGVRSQAHAMERVA